MRKVYQIIQLLLFFSWHRTLAKETDKTHPGTYLILGPNTFRPGSTYAVSVNILQNADPINLEISIIDEQNKTIAKSSQNNVKSGEPITVKIDKVPENLIEGSQYKFMAEGTSTKTNKVVFKDVKDLTLSEKRFSVFIQTDKATYKPGAKVNFRIIAVDSNLKPYKGVANINIKDPQQNIMKQYSDVSLENGVLGKNGKLSFELSDEPVLGSWNIYVDINGQQSVKEFKVEKYVLPKFEVTIKTPNYILFDQDLEVLVSAKYTYGKGVAGVGTVTISGSYYDNQNMTVMVKKLELNSTGEQKIKIYNEDMQKHLILVADKEYFYYRSVVVDVSFTETLTGTQKNQSSSISVELKKYILSIKKHSEMFHPGMDYEFSITVKDRDDKPLPSSEPRLVNISLSYSLEYNRSAIVWNENTTFSPPIVQKNLTVKLDTNGTGTVTVTTLVNTTSMTITADYITQRVFKYLDPNLSETDYVQATASPTDSYLQVIKDKDEDLKVGESLTVVAKTTADLSTVTAQIMSKGVIVYSKNFKVSSKTAAITIPITADMIPRARLIVYGIQPSNKEIVVDAFDIKINGLFRNDVTMSADPKRVEPNATVHFKVKASPKSYVGLLALDKSVILLRTGNDISREDVENEMYQYTGGSPGGFYIPWLDKRHKRSFYWLIGGQDASSVFENSGVFVLTDAFLYQYTEEYAEPRSFMGMGGGPVAAGPLGPAIATTAIAASAPPAQDKAGEPEPRIRSKFLETWIWADATVGDNGQVVYTAEAPDTITSFVATAFALHDTDGFSVAPEPATVEVFRPFFIRMDLPYSAKRGEKLALQIILFNYGDETQTVTVTLDHDKQSGFEFVDKAGETKDKKDKNLNTRMIKVPGRGGSASAYFPIRPSKIGNIKLLVKAYGQGVSDGVENELLIEAEGYPLYFNKAFAVELSNQSTGGNGTKIDFPQDMVPGSQKVSVSVVGDIMAPLLNNIGDLIQMPYGCGEQNMLHFVPNIVVSNYLKATNRLSPEKSANSNRYMEIGYQRELTYQRTDSSFSVFGNSDKNGSTWLTAFVVKSFHQAKPYIFVDDALLNRSIDFLMSQMKDNGAFIENGEVHDKDLQGGVGDNNVALSAYVFISLLVNERKSPETLAYLERSLSRISNDSYALAIVCYAFHLVKSSKKDECMASLEKIAIKKLDMKYWSKVVSHDDDKKHNYWWWRPRPADIETTSYVMLSYLLRGDPSKATPLFRWMSQQQNAFGGYSSTQDTVIALQALGEYAEKTFSSKANVVVNVKNGNKTINFEIKPENALIQQIYQIPNVNEPIVINASGKGVAFGQISYHYNVFNVDNIKPFTCHKDVYQKTVGDLMLNLCCKYNLKGNSNMAVMEVQTPSGFSIDMTKLNELIATLDQLQRVESDSGDSQANLYFTSLNSTETCFNVTSQRYYGFVEQKPAIVKLYDYYNPSERTEFEYNTIKNATLKDFCGIYCWSNFATNETIVD